MKIVINRCYGGFGLSEQAIDKIYARANMLTRIDEPEFA